MKLRNNHQFNNFLNNRFSETSEAGYTNFRGNSHSGLFVSRRKTLNQFNKKAKTGNFFMIIAFMFILIFISVGIIIGIYMFFGSELDFRQIDSDVLNFRIKKCISEKEINWEHELDLYKKCLLNEQVIKDNFLVLIKINNEIKYDHAADEIQCDLSEKNDAFPKCTNSNFNKNGNDIYILTGSEQRSKEKVA